MKRVDIVITPKTHDDLSVCYRIHEGQINSFISRLAVSSVQVIESGRFLIAVVLHEVETYKESKTKRQATNKADLFSNSVSGFGGSMYS